MRRDYTDKELLAMKEIAEILKENKGTNNKLSRFDYFLLGGISFDEALSAIYHFRKLGVIIDNEYYLLNNYITAERKIEVLRNKHAILSTRFMFSNKIITDVEKEVIWNQLINAGIKEKDIDDIVFSAAVREYAIRNGYVKQIKKNTCKTKTLKK